MASALTADFYEMTGAEAKDMMAAAAAKREQESVLRTKATREMEAARKKRVYRKALVRVRFPDGVTLQATTPNPNPNPNLTLTLRR